MKPFHIPVNERGETRAMYQMRRVQEARDIIARHAPIETPEADARLRQALKDAGFSLEVMANSPSEVN